MKLVNIEKSKATALATFRFTRGNPFRFDLLAEVKSRYNFQAVEDNAPDGTIQLKFGSWKKLQIDEFGVYSDGFIIASRNNTDIIDSFIDDLHKMIDEKFGIIAADHPKPVRIYESNLVVELSPKLERSFDVLSGLYEDLNSLNSSTAYGERYRLGGLHVEAESPITDARRPPSFTLARRIGVEFDAGYWFSAAGLRTDDHLSVIGNLEKRLLK